MVFIAVVKYENDTSLERVYRLRHIARYIKRVKEGDPSIAQIRSLPIIPWLIDMVFEEADHSIPIKCIEIQERITCYEA
jgi:hypothetical protein